VAAVVPMVLKQQRLGTVSLTVWHFRKLADFFLPFFVTTLKVSLFSLFTHFTCRGPCNIFWQPSPSPDCVLFSLFGQTGVCMEGRGTSDPG